MEAMERFSACINSDTCLGSVKVIRSKFSIESAGLVFEAFQQLYRFLCGFHARTFHFI